MSLAEGVSARITVKQYTSGAIDPETDPDPFAAGTPGSDGGQILRRVSSSLALTKDTYQSNEIISHRQIADFRHGVKRVTGGITGELSPLTYEAPFEACLRGTWAVSAVSKTQSELTSLAASNSGSTLTCGGGDPVSEGFRIGDIVQATDLSESANNSINFLITGFTGASNRTIAVYPAPTDMGADTSFTLATQGRSLYIPASSHVSRKFAVEIWNQDIDVARLFTECRFGGFNVQLPPTGIGTVDFTMLGRNMKMYDGSNAPFFSSPTAETTTGLVASVNGLLRIAGATVAVITGLNIQLEDSPSGDPVVGSNLLPEIFLGRSVVTGQMTAFFEDGTLINDFINETEISVLAYLSTSSDADTPALTFYLPRVKLGGAQPDTSGEGGQSITMPFTALKADGATAGDEATTIRICDTEQT